MSRTYSIYMDELYMLGVIVFGGGTLLDSTIGDFVSIFDFSEKFLSC